MAPSGSCTYGLSELLVDVLGVTDVGAYYPHRVTYHPTCHSLRMLRVGDKPLQLLRAVHGLELLTERVEDHRASVHRVADAAQVPAVVGTVPEALARLDPAHPLTFVSGRARVRARGRPRPRRPSGRG